LCSHAIEADVRALSWGTRSLPTRGVGTPRSCEDDFEAAPDEGRNTVVVLLPGGARCCRATAGVPRSEALPTEWVGTPRSR